MLLVSDTKWISKGVHSTYSQVASVQGGVPIQERVPVLGSHLAGVLEREVWLEVGSDELLRVVTRFSSSQAELELVVVGCWHNHCCHRVFHAPLGASACLKLPDVPSLCYPSGCHDQVGKPSAAQCVLTKSFSSLLAAWEHSPGLIPPSQGGKLLDKQTGWLSAEQKGLGALAQGVARHTMWAALSAAVD